MSDAKKLELRKSKFQEYGFDRLNITPKKLPTPITNNIALSPDNPDMKDAFIDIAIKDMEHLKLLVGIPSNLVKEKKNHAIDETQDIYQLAKMAVLSDWTNDLANSKRADEIEKFILSHAKSIKVGVFEDLVVNDGQKVNLTEPSYYFDNITVYGTGEIILSDHVKLVVSGEVSYIPAQGGK